MKWIVLGIIVGIAVYTYLTLHYRKPGPAYRPYEDFTNRANVERLLNAGFRRIETNAERPADPQMLIRAMGALATVTDVAGGLPGGLSATFIDAPLLPQIITSVYASKQIQTGLPYTVLFNCSLPNQKEQLGGSQIYIKDNTIAIVPQFEALAGGLIARTKESVVSITIPGGILQPGRYIVTLTAIQSSKRWTLEVK
jgi:hypothetical protein